MDTPKPKTTPKDFFLWLGAMVALYVSAVSFILLYHTYIEAWFPDELIRYGDPYSGPIRFAIAALIVMFPLFIWFVRMLHKDVEREPVKKELWVRRWLVFLTLFIAGLVMAIDVIMLILSYLEGELSVRFGLKAFTVLAVLSGIFWYFLEELRGTWERKPKTSNAIGIATLILVLASVAASFFIVGSPETARLLKIDEQKVADLQNIQWQVLSYWQQKERLPASLAELKDPLSGFTLPTDPETGEDYGYRVTTAPHSFELCADFNLAVTEGKVTEPIMSPDNRPVSVHTGDDNWNHNSGQTCFERTIDPERYPPFEKLPR